MHGGFCAAHETGTFRWDGRRIRASDGLGADARSGRFLRNIQARDGIGRQDLNVRGMARIRRLARSIVDGGLFAFRRQLA